VALLALLLPFSCGVPNPYEFQTTLLSPESVDARFDGENIVLKITGDYPPQSAPDFSGYNLYWYRLNAAQTILQQFVFADNLYKPSVNARPGEGRSTVTVNFSQWWWSNTATGVVTREPFNAHDSYFLIVTAWAGRTRMESSGYNSVAEVRIPKWLTRQSLFEEVPYTNDGPGFKVSGSSLIPQNGSFVQSAGAAASWTNVFPAPVVGYGSAPLPLFLKHVYYFYAVTPTTNYAKLWVEEHQGSNLLFHWAFLKGSPML